MPSEKSTNQDLPEWSIACRGLHVTLGGKQVLNGLDFSMAPGEIVSLLGASGCGKSTLLRTIAGIVHPQSGTIEFGRGGQESKDREAELSFVFQEATLLPWRTVESNVRLPLELKSSTNNGVSIPELLRQVGLNERDWGKLPGELSGGMKMRASLARALVTDPDLLLLDEPFAALDDILRTKLNELLLQIWSSRSRTIVFVTHNIAEAIFLSHRIAIMGQGKIAEWYSVDLPKDRRSDIRSTLPFATIYGEVAKKLEEQKR